MHSVPPPAQPIRRARRILGQFALVLGLLFPAAGFADTILYRVNVGGPQLAALDAGPVWARDQNLPNASPYGNAAATGDNIFDSSAPLGPRHASVPAYVPAGVFTYERWDPPVSLGVRLVSVIDDDLEHAGQAAYIRGLAERDA